MDKTYEKNATRKMACKDFAIDRQNEDPNVVQNVNENVEWCYGRPPNVGKGIHEVARR